jgi:hypothetical protein
MKFKLLATAMVLAFANLPHGAKASIVYYVDAVSGGFSVVRQITTDGNIGALKAKDITGWGLVCHRRVECGADDQELVTTAARHRSICHIVRSVL